jgi:hypothetical protein
MDLRIGLPSIWTLVKDDVRIIDETLEAARAPPQLIVNPSRSSKQNGMPVTLRSSNNQTSFTSRLQQE